MHRFRFAVQLSRAASGHEWRALARKAEDLGYSTLLMPDHLDEQWSPFVALTVAAECTTALRVGTLVLGNDYRHPVLVAREAATLDLLSEGRFELGMGAGWMTSDYEQAGIVLDDPGMRVERLAESVVVVKGLLRSGTTSASGPHYRLAGASGYPAPSASHTPPIMIGGGSPRVLALAGREADIVGVNPRLTPGVIGPEAIASAVPEAYDRRLQWIRQAAGDRMEQIELQCLTFVVRVVPDGQRVIDELAPMFSMTPAEAAQTPVALVGTVEQIADTLEARRARWGFSYIVVHEAELDVFAPVVSRLTGK